MLLEKLDTPKKGGKIECTIKLEILASLFSFYDAEIDVYRHAAAKPLPQETYLKFSVLEYCMN